MRSLVFNHFLFPVGDLALGYNPRLMIAVDVTSCRVPDLVQSSSFYLTVK
jgi:hypothetical protein